MQKSESLIKITGKVLYIKYHNEDNGYKAKLSNGSVTITDEELLDPKFIKEKRQTSIDKAAIKKAILAGEDVEGASIEKTLSLVVS